MFERDVKLWIALITIAPIIAFAYGLQLLLDSVFAGLGVASVLCFLLGYMMCLLDKKPTKIDHTHVASNDDLNDVA